MTTLSSGNSIAYMSFLIIIILFIEVKLDNAIVAAMQTIYFIFENIKKCGSHSKLNSLWRRAQENNCNK